MHTVVIQREKLKQHPWLARSVVKAYLESIEYAYKAIGAQNGALNTILPWQIVSGPY
jgi:4,5-dihydroxyphthalate decarboxylase